MIKKELPLTALRAFLAAAKHCSFTKAAAGLGVTQSAVSRHVATLETMSGKSLFIRHGPQLSLTPHGQQLFDETVDAMAAVEQATQRFINPQPIANRLHVRTSMPSFSMKLIVPGLHEYTHTSGMPIDLITSLVAPQPQDLFDVLISRDQILSETDSWELAREELICVGSAAMVLNATNATDDWSKPIIVTRSRPDIMSKWATALGSRMPPHHIVATYDHLFFAIAAATGGMGLLVTPKLLVIDQLQDGTLVQWGNTQVASGARYISYINPLSTNTQAATEFCRWLKRRLRAYHNA